MELEILFSMEVYIHNNLLKWKIVDPYVRLWVALKFSNMGVLLLKAFFLLQGTFLRMHKKH